MTGDGLLTYRIAFSRIKGMTVGAARHMLEALGSGEAFFRLDLREMERLTGLGSRHFRDGMREELLSRAREEVRFVTANAVRCLYFTDGDFPRRLLECEDAPLMLYGKDPDSLRLR